MSMEELLIGAEQLADWQSRGVTIAEAAISIGYSPTDSTEQLLLMVISRRRQVAWCRAAFFDRRVGIELGESP